ncbi:MAG: fructokinase [Bacteroidales bacterium]|nr:fructokinase [Bacteroidales bacterium]
MKRVFCIGETVLDIIFRNNLPVAAKPGGSMLNSSVSLGRVGLNPVFISDFGQDAAGELISHFLETNGVDTHSVLRFTDGQTAISLAFLDADSNASYSFYRNFPEKRNLSHLPDAQEGDIVIFGSFYAIDHEVRQPVWAFLLRARTNGAFLVYDPNFRKPHLDKLPQFRPWILENISIAQITRGSAVDFFQIFEVNDAAGAYQEIKNHGGDTLVYTKSNEGVEVITPEYHLKMAVPNICPVSTIGAGDAFNAGVIYALSELPKANPLPLDKGEWEKIIQLAIEFSTDVCMSLDNYISIEFAQKVRYV